MLTSHGLLHRPCKEITSFECWPSREGNHGGAEGPNIPNGLEALAELHHRQEL